MYKLGPSSFSFYFSYVLAKGSLFIGVLIQVDLRKSMEESWVYLLSKI